MERDTEPDLEGIAAFREMFALREGGLKKVSRCLILYRTVISSYQK
jgi:hypothetical protein